MLDLSDDIENSLDWDAQYDWVINPAHDCSNIEERLGQKGRVKLEVVSEDFLVNSEEESIDLDWNSASNSTMEPNYAGDWSLGAAMGFALPSNVPPDYSDLAEVFSKQRATTLPPHHAYDCAIDLQPGTLPQRFFIFSIGS